MTTLPLLDCSEMLTIDPKTLRHWLRQAGIPLQPHPTDARVKCLTMEQVQALAALHGRALKPHPALPSGSGASTSACGEPKPLTSPAYPQKPTCTRSLLPWKRRSHCCTTNWLTSPLCCWGSRLPLTLHGPPLLLSCHPQGRCGPAQQNWHRRRGSLKSWPGPVPIQRRTDGVACFL